MNDDNYPTYKNNFGDGIHPLIQKVGKFIGTTANTRQIFGPALN